MSDKLLLADEPAPVELIFGGNTKFLFTCEHAGRAVPRSLNNLELSEQHFDHHIAYDIGAAGLSRMLSKRLDATLVMQRYSRLVIDCNRPVESHDSIAVVSDGTHVPGNHKLSDEERNQRVTQIHEPYHQAIAEQIDLIGEVTILVSIHSFTPSMNGFNRPWHAGLLFNRDDRLAKTMMPHLSKERFNITYNQPYSVDDEHDYTIPVHGETRGIPHVLIEVRDDEISDPQGQEYWARHIATALEAAAQEI